MPILANLMRDLHEAISPFPTSDQAARATCEVLKRYSQNTLELPERIRQPSTPCYARHLLHLEENDGYCIVAMVWSPGQGTAVHDHGGNWCVEACLEGRLEITSFRLLEELPTGNVRLTRETSVKVGQGSVGCLIPPFEHHKIHNPFDVAAITIHVYETELRNCTRYIEESGDVYRLEKVPLSYTTSPFATPK